MANGLVEAHNKILEWLVLLVNYLITKVLQMYFSKLNKMDIQTGDH